jgi:hypothetical protein
MRPQNYNLLNSKYLWFVSLQGASRDAGTDVTLVKIIRASTSNFLGAFIKLRFEKSLFTSQEMKV